MSTAQSTAKTGTQWKPNDAWLIGIVLAVINFWLFAQTLGLVQVAAGMSSLPSGLLTLGYLTAILSTIRVGEKLLQRFGPKRPMI